MTGRLGIGLPILDVQDVFKPKAVTGVPLANRERAGVRNLRGGMVTAIDMRKQLCLPPLAADKPRMTVGIENNGESCSLIIDADGEVNRLSSETFETNPANLDPRWAAISAGVHRLDGSLMVVIDAERVLARDESVIAAWQKTGSTRPEELCGKRSSQ